MLIKRTVIIVLLSFVVTFYGQNSVVASGNTFCTIGENLTRMQEFDTIITEVSLGTPTFEVPIETSKKPIIKKKSFIQKIIEFFKKLISK